MLGKLIEGYVSNRRVLGILDEIIAKVDPERILNYPELYKKYKNLPEENRDSLLFKAGELAYDLTHLFSIIRKDYCSVIEKIELCVQEEVNIKGNRLKFKMRCNSP